MAGNSGASDGLHFTKIEDISLYLLVIKKIINLRGRAERNEVNQENACRPGRHPPLAGKLSKNAEAPLCGNPFFEADDLARRRQTGGTSTPKRLWFLVSC